MGRASAGTLTTLIFQLTRPYQTAKLTIHDLSGSLVKNVPSSEISLQAGPNLPSADFKWVYEYNWDGKNDGGESVASGVYLYRFKADENVIKTGKIAVVR
jgi:flagellar hook assembly protein FlgD